MIVRKAVILTETKDDYNKIEETVSTCTRVNIDDIRDPRFLNPLTLYSKFIILQNSLHKLGNKFVVVSRRDPVIISYRILETISDILDNLHKNYRHHTNVLLIGEEDNYNYRYEFDDDIDVMICTPTPEILHDFEIFVQGYCTGLRFLNKIYLDNIERVLRLLSGITVDIDLSINNIIDIPEVSFIL